jgi:high affinity choline transporter 7
VNLKRLLRVSIVALGAGAAVLALKVQSVQALWFFTSDLVYVLLFPQLLCALYDPKANLAGSVVAFSVSLVLRLGGGEPLLGLPPWIPYPEIFRGWLPGAPADWYDGSAMIFPFKTLAAATGLVLLPLVSRATARWSPPRPLRPVEDSGSTVREDDARNKTDQRWTTADRRGAQGRHTVPPAKLRPPSPSP